MENRSLSVAACLISLALLGGPAWAADQGPDSEQQAAWQLRLDKAAALSAEGRARQAEASRILEEKNAACRKKFLVNACLQENQEEYSAAARQGKLLENEGRAIERQVRKEQLSDSDVRRQAAAPQREAELQERQAEVAATREAAANKEATIRADQAKKAVEGEKRKAADAEKLHRKQAAHDARVAEQMRKAAQRASEAGTPRE